MYLNLHMIHVMWREKIYNFVEIIKYDNSKICRRLSKSLLSNMAKTRPRSAYKLASGHKIFYVDAPTKISNKKVEIYRITTELIYSLG